MAHRKVSIESAVSTVSTSTSASQMAAAPDTPRGSRETGGTPSVASLIAAAGSPEAALEKLLGEKQQAASHNAQLWRLVEKQRAMILGLNKDLERSLKEKEKYRKKLKDHLAQSPSAPALLESSPPAAHSPATREIESAASDARPGEAAIKPHPWRDESSETRKTSDTSDVASFGTGRSDTPQDMSLFPLPGGAVKGHSANGVSTRSLRDIDSAHVAANGSAATTSRNDPSSQAARTKPRADTPPFAYQLVGEAPPGKALAKSGTTSPTSPQANLSPSTASASGKSRKAPPAPLKLDRRADAPVASNIIDASDSDDYEDDPESARGEYLDRGRRKTREEDDREREAQAKLDDEQRSRSKKDKPSKSQPPAQAADEPPAVSQPTHVQGGAGPLAHPELRPKAVVYRPTGTPADGVPARAGSDATYPLRNHPAAPLLTPGLPMSPRPGDRPLNSPMPRAPINSIPMSPKSGMPLSPRAPRQAIPLPPTTNLPLTSPHLDRAKAYHQMAQSQAPAVPTVVVPPDRTQSSADSSPDGGQPSITGDQSGAGRVYLGLVTEQYPDLLLPPNALPSIYVKTASSRMRPSRHSLIMPKPADENPVFTLAVYERARQRQLWRVEKTFASLAALDQHVRAVCDVRDRLPEKALFTGHAPARIDARRTALDTYFLHLLDAIVDDQGAMIVCQFLSGDPFGPEEGEGLGAAASGRVDTPTNKLRPNRAGYLTKRGKNFGGWKARYFVLDGPTLKYFEGPGGAQLGLIKLQNAQIGKQSPAQHSASEDEDNQFRHAFLILEPKKKDSSSLVRHVLCAESDEERDAWVDALLQYVDYQGDSDEQQTARQAQVVKTDISSPRSPRFQRSTSDFRQPQSHKDPSQTKQGEAFHTISYSDTVAGDAPTMGPQTPRVSHSHQSSQDKTHSSLAEQSGTGHLNISGPTNLQVISNAGDWGMRPPLTPSSRDGKKRGVLQLIRSGRPSTESAANEKPATGPAERSPGVSRPVFGVQLAEAVEFAPPIDVDTELPAVVYRCIEYLLAKNAVAEEGIFRLSGSSTVIKSLKERFNHEGDVNLLADGTYYDVHAVASLLKLYLRELPTSILTRDLHLQFLDCVGLPADENVRALNALVHRLPAPNYALLQALSRFLLAIVNNVGVNKMTVRNLGVVFSPTLNLPGPLISLFVEEQEGIFGPALPFNGASHAPPPPLQIHTRGGSGGSGGSGSSQTMDLRSPRKQMFSDLPTPAYHQTQFQSLIGAHPSSGIDDAAPSTNNTGMIPMHPTYANYQMAPQGEGGFGSLNDALRSPTVYNTVGMGAPTPRDIKVLRRESGSGPQLAAPPSRKASSGARRGQPEEGVSF